MFLSYIAEEIRIGIEYKNRLGFGACFALRFMELDEPVFSLKDFGAALMCRKAFIEPDFSKLLKEKAIIIECRLTEASFSGDFSIPGWEEVANVVFDNVYTTLFIYKDGVRFSSFSAYSKELKLSASGFAGEDGSLDLNTKIWNKTPDGWTSNGIKVNFKKIK